VDDFRTSLARLEERILDASPLLSNPPVSRLPPELLLYFRHGSHSKLLRDNRLKIRALRDDFRTFFVSECQSSVQFEDLQQFVAQIQR